MGNESQAPPSEAVMRSFLEEPRLLKEQALVSGRWQGGEMSLTVWNPATGDAIGTVPSLSAIQVREGIEAAHFAGQSWGQTTAEHRSRLLHSWFDLIQKHRGDLATLIELEQGKRWSEALDEVEYAASFVKWFSEEARRNYGDTVPSPRRGQQILVTREPVGVVAAITPWNFPAAMVTRKLAPALAAGCTVLLKPAEQTPLTALALAELALEAGVPPDVLSVLTGDPQLIGGELTGSPLVRKLTFTGSTQVGKMLYEQCASTLKRLSLELGGNAPFIVFDDADLDVTVNALRTAKFRNSGQSCVAANRVLVQAGIAVQFIERIEVELRAGTLLAAPNSADGSRLAPLIDEAAKGKMIEHILDAVASGATLRYPDCLAELDREPGTAMPPVLLTGMNERMLASTQETFAPVLAVTEFGSEEQAITLANETPYGLAAYVCTQSLRRAMAVSEALDVGMIGVNTGAISTTVAPFGGVKWSGLGREGSRYGLDEYTELKYIALSFADGTDLKGTSLRTTPERTP